MKIISKKMFSYISRLCLFETLEEGKKKLKIKVACFKQFPRLQRATFSLLSQNDFLQQKRGGNPNKYVMK